MKFAKKHLPVIAVIFSLALSLIAIGISTFNLNKNQPAVAQAACNANNDGEYDWYGNPFYMTRNF